MLSFFILADTMEVSVLFDKDSALHGTIRIFSSIEKNEHCFLPAAKNIWKPFSHLQFFQAKQKIENPFSSEITYEVPMTKLDDGILLFKTKEKTTDFTISFTAKNKMDKNLSLLGFSNLIPDHIDCKNYNHKTNITKIKTQSANSSYLLLASGSKRASDLSFLAVSGYKKTEQKTNNIPILFVSKSDFMDNIMNSATGALSNFYDLFGPLDLSNLLIIEADEQYPLVLPGVIFLHKPKQKLFQYLQNNLLNWKHWVIAHLIAYQWYGISTYTIDDSWLLNGICDLATLHYLKSAGSRFNLFNSYDSNLNLLYINFLQFQELNAAYYLRNLKNYAILKKDFTKTVYNKEEKYGFSIKNFFALRFLSSLMGENIKDFFNLLSRKYKHTYLTPKAFYDELRFGQYGISAEKREIISKYLKQWWMEESWPNYALLETKSENLAPNIYHNTINIKMTPPYDLPVALLLTDAYGNKQRVGPSLVATKDISIISTFKPNNITLDPDHDLFDQNRFDNSTQGPNLHFFPLGTNQLSNEDYTALWLPYAVRRPGEGTFLGMRGTILKFLEKSISYKWEFSPSLDRHYFLLDKQWPIKKDALDLNFNIEKNIDNKKSGEANVLWSKISSFLSLKGSLKVEDYPNPNKDFIPSVTITPIFSAANDNFTINSRVIVEKGYSNKSTKKPYIRNANFLNMDFSFKIFNLKSESFYGQLLGRQDYEHKLFRANDTNEAAIKIDQRNIPLFSTLWVERLSLFFPLKIPLPDNTLILSKHLKGEIFYDGGKGYTPKNLILRASGLGVNMPFGGDIVGVGSVHIQSLSLWLVFYDSMEANFKLPPDILFNLSAQI